MRKLCVVAVIAWAALLALAAPVAAGGPVIIGNDTPDDCSSQMGSIEFEGMAEEHQAIVEPGGRIYEANGEYPLPPGEYNAFIVLPGVEIVSALEFVIHPCRVAPRPTMPPTDTAERASGPDGVLHVAVFLVAVACGIAVFGLRREAA